ncbi:MAG: UDP-2,4-diacetamido-2,4,6-trideoxy-beta-L-altropyranose hydrolase [Cyclobacteriaceae bacterium]|nr:UDP-2,4-diacetamido-2,4,6-trideoxy-beta-L-altropyranose hydrolase [Cyclobacteriaceae bacterium]
MKKGRIVFRVDGNSAIGMGHISRCMALAQVLKEYDIQFAIRNPDDFVKDSLRAIGAVLLPLDSDDKVGGIEFASLLSNDDIVVLDGYSFTTDYEKLIKEHAGALVTIDDIPSRHFVANAVINFCGAIDPKAYSRESYTKICFGSDYIFLRQPFLSRPVVKQPTGNRILLNMGGADANNQTMIVLNEILPSALGIPIDVVVGHTYAFFDELKAVADKHHQIIPHRGLSAHKMFEVMANCNIAILPPSTVALEFLSTGGQLFLKQTADNQTCIKQYLITRQFAFDYSHWDFFVSDISQSRFRPKTLNFDSSNKSVHALFNSLRYYARLRLRLAMEQDARLIYDWATDVEARQYAYDKSEISWDNHLKWFAAKLESNKCNYYIAEIEEFPIGQIRFDFSDEEEGIAIISYLIDKSWRGKGLSVSLLTKSIQQLSVAKRVKKIVGFVQNANIASIKAFTRAGFTIHPAEKYPDSSKFELSLKNQYE